MLKKELQNILQNDTEYWKLLVKKVFSLKELVIIIQKLYLIKFVNGLKKRKDSNNKAFTCSCKIRNTVTFCHTYNFIGYV